MKGFSITIEPEDQAFLAEIGEQFRIARLEAGLTVNQVASSMGVSAKLIDEVEKGERDLTMSEVRLYCLAVEARFEWEMTDMKTGEVTSSMPA